MADTQTTPELYGDPNRFARPAGLDLFEQSAFVHGYQEFVITPHEVQPMGIDEQLKRKFRLLKPLLDDATLLRRSVLDLGANGGFFSIWCLRNGARAATALDMDEEYCSIIERLRDRFEIDDLRVVRANVTDWSEPSDVVIALALVHWIYSCTAVLGTLSTVVGLLASLTDYLLIVEWIDPEDPAVRSFGHTSYNERTVAGPYDRETFEAALDEHFAKWRKIGDVTPTRALYAANKTEREIAWSCPLPMLHPEETVIYSRRLAFHEGSTYWSRVYDDGDAIHKQTTADLAAREARLLSRLDGEHFPRVKDARTEDGTSVVVLEKIDGAPLRRAASSIGGDRERFLRFARGMVEILRRLRLARIAHRDIRADNIIVRDGSPVLIDFGWADAQDDPSVNPRWLGSDGRPPDGSFSDTYSAGLILKRLAVNQTAFSVVCDLMSDPDPRSRIEDPDVLSVVLEAAAEASS